MKKAFTTTIFAFLFIAVSFGQTMIAVSSNQFTPADITIEVGETVQWDNTGGFHNVNGTTATYPSNPEGFTNGGASSSSWTFSHTFSTAGTYNYQCDPHVGLGMVGTITVNPAPANADLVITEIMYNTPGFDDFEFIEIYNAGSATENLEGYYFTSGIEDTIGNVDIAPGAYLVLAQFSDNMLNTFGVNAEQWFTNNLNNSGESIVLRNPAGEVVDSVAYSDDAPYHEICDGEGPSLELCDVNADNSDPANWRFSTTNTGVLYGANQQVIFASAGFANNTCADVPYIFLDASQRVVNEADGTYNLGIHMANVGMMDTTDLTFTVSGTSTATDGSDYTIPNLVVGMGGDGPGSSTFGSLPINIIDDMDEEGDETVVLNITMTTNGVVLATSSFTMIIEDNDGLNYPAYDIATLTTNDADGVADSLGAIAQIQGIVHGVDLQGNDDLQFTVIDATGGIGLFSGNGNNFGYTVAEGDEVIVQGAISQFRGLTQINPDTLWMTSAGNALVVPPVVTALDETTESELVQINGLTIVDPTEWDGNGSSFNVDFTDGTNTYLIRIDNDVDLSNSMAPVGCVDIVGIGGQFDFDAPFDSGYQLLPRYAADITPCAGTGITAVDDMATTDVNEAINIEVLNNDITPNGIATIAVDAGPSFGSVNTEADNSLTYTPMMDFCGDDSFTYIICDATAACDTALVSITINCPTIYTPYPIDQVTSNDANGEPDSLGVLVEISGLVYGVDLQGDENIQFFIIDKFNPDAGISLFSDNDFGYTVNEGDEVIVQGAISQFRGLTQISPDTLWSISSGNTLHDPTVVTTLDETTESKLIKFVGMSLVDPTQWTGAGAGFNVDITNGTDTVTMRIDNEVDLYSMAAPAFPVFNVTGLGGQFDFDAPYDSGYQFLPRYEPDIEEFVSVVDPTISETISFFPNPVSETLNVNMSVNMDQLRITNILGQDIRVIENPANEEAINVSNLASGMYVLTFVNGDRIWSTQFVKE